MGRLSIWLFSAFLLLTPPSHATEELTWFIWDQPPEFIKSGEWANQGYGDKFLKYFMDRLPDYNHHIQRVNIARWSSEVLKPGRCTAYTGSGFFPDHLILSKPYSIMAPQVVIFHKRHRTRIGTPGSTIALQDLLKQDDLRLMVQRINFNQNARQSRFPILYPWLAPYLGKPNLIEISAARNDVDLRLLERQRADYTIAYPTTITTQERVYGIPNEYITYNIREHFFFKKVYVACNKTDFGRRVIEQVNRLITKESLKTFLTYHEEWNGQDPYYRKIYSDYFLKGFLPGNIVD